MINIVKKSNLKKHRWCAWDSNPGMAVKEVTMHHATYRVILSPQIPCIVLEGSILLLLGTLLYDLPN